jgi:hypothetical protein
MRRPAEFVSPFQINRKRPDIPVSKAVYLRRKIISEPELQQYVSFFTAYFFMLQLFSYWHCNCYTPSFAICTLVAITHSTLFLQPLTQTNLQSHVVKPSCNCFHTGIATVTLPVLQFVHFLQSHIQHFFCNHSHRQICNHMLSNLVAIVFILALQLLHSQFCNLYTF